MNTPSTPTDIDPRPLFAAAAVTAQSVVDAVKAADLPGPTPCAEFTVETLLAHVVEVLRKTAMIGRGENAFAGPTAPADDAPDAWSGLVAESIVDAANAWINDSSLTQHVTLPWAEMSGAQALCAYVSELTTHLWDVSRAIDFSPEWNPEVVAVSLFSIQMGLPAGDRAAAFEEAFAHMPPEAQGWGYPFANAVAVAEDAPLIDRLVAWTGRDPNWTSSLR